MKRINGALVAISFVLVATMATSALAGYILPESEINPDALKVDEKEFLGVKLGTGYRFIDQDGKEFGFGDFRDKPLILVLSYYTCDGFCPSFNTDLRNVLEKVEKSGKVSAGKDFSIITLSFDKNDDKESANQFISELYLPSPLLEAWTVGVFSNKEKIEAFTSSIGYKFFWSPADRMFFHPNAYFFISPEGRVVRILHGSVTDASDMELAILDTKFSRMKPAEIINMAISLCYSYNFKEGKYGLNYPLFIAIGSLFSGIGAFAYAAHVSRKNNIRTANLRGKGE